MQLQLHAARCADVRQECQGSDPCGIGCCVARQPTAIAGDDANGDAALVAGPGDHFVAGRVHRKAQDVEAAAHIGDSGGREGTDGLGDGYLAHWRYPWRSMSSAFRMAPPAAPRTVLWTNSTNL